MQLLERVMNKSNFTKKVMKMALEEKIILSNDKFIKETVDEFLSTSKIPVAMSTVSSLIIEYIYNLNLKEENNG